MGNIRKKENHSGPGDGRTWKNVCPEAHYSGAWAQLPRILERIKPPLFPDTDFNILEFGAVADGKTDCLPAVNRAVSACAASGGGRVLVPPGDYLVKGPVHLDSNIDLHLEEGSKILFGTDFRDYLPPVLYRWEGTLLYNYSPLIYAYRKKNIAVTGNGELDGQARYSWNRFFEPAKPVRKTLEEMNRDNNDLPPLEKRVFGEGYFLRPSMVVFYECENILFEGVKIVDSPFWCFHPTFCRNVTARNVRFHTNNYNNDGIDPDSCEDVYIHDVVFDNGDDNIAIKSGRDKEGREIGIPSRNIVIRNCEFNSFTGIKLGSEGAGGICNVFAENCTARSRLFRGVCLMTMRGRGGEYSRVRMRNMTFLDTESDMLSLSTNYRISDCREVPAIRDIRIEDFKAEGPCDTGVKIEGQPEKLVSDVVLRNIEINNARQEKCLEYMERCYFQNVKINGNTLNPAEEIAPPDVYAGEDISTGIFSGSPLRLEGSAWAEGNPEEIEYEWTVEEGGEEAVIIADPAAASTEAFFKESGRYALKLTARYKGRAGSHVLKVDVNSQQKIP